MTDGKRENLDGRDLFRAGKNAVADCTEIKVHVVADGATVEATYAQSGETLVRAMNVFAYQSFMTGYVVEMANRKRLA